MKEYRIKGLSCPNCAQDLEKRIQALKYGENAKISYSSGRLTVSKDVDLDKVSEILASDGAAISGMNEDHDHSNGYLKWYLLISTVIFVSAILLENWFASNYMITMYVVAMVLSGHRTFMSGLKNVMRFHFNIDTLMTIALVGAVSIGEWKEGTLVAILFGLNEYLEGLGMEKARKSMEKLLTIAPEQALVIKDGKEQTIPIDRLKEDDIILVRPGEKIPSDGIVIDGKSSVNEAAITGESLPVEKETNEPVFGGSINNEGVLKIRTTKAYEDSSLAKILHLVKEAQETKTPTELFINRFAKYYTPLIMVIAAAVMFIPPLLLNGDWGTWVYQGLAVLIVGCPCALILSSPIANISGITRNARHGILVKGSVFLEQLGKINVLAFDKTGTLTKGEPQVEKMKAYREDEFYAVAAAIEKSSSHPLAKAIMDKLAELPYMKLEADEIETVSGQGIRALINGKKYWLGNEKSIPHLSLSAGVKREIDDLKNSGLTLVLVASEHELLGYFAIADKVRKESKDVIAKLHQAGIKRTVMLTGDHEKTAENVARTVGVSDYYASLLPEDKVAKIKQFARNERVAMVGDGINDAPALATAHLGIAMGKGTDSAIETADIVLMQDHLGKLPDAISLSKRVNRIIRFNIALALGLKAFALLLTIPGWLTLWIAILSDMGATIIVTLISLTILLEWKKRGANETMVLQRS